MRGRKPKPIELRVLHGTAGERARSGVPRPRRVQHRCPDYVPEGPARDEWKRLVGDLYDAGLYTAVDRNALGMYCVVFARWVDAEAKVTENGGPVVKTKDGNVIQNPFLSVANRALEQLNKMAAEFGMTPSSRTRVRAELPNVGRKEPEARQVVRNPRENEDDPRKALG